MCNTAAGRRVIKINIPFYLLTLFHMKKFGLMLAMLAMFSISMGVPVVNAWTFIPINTIIKVVTPVSTPTVDKTPSMVIRSTEVGSLQYPDECVSTTTQINADQDTTITFNQLDIGVYDSCRIILSYMDFNGSFFEQKTDTLYVPDFEIIPLKIIPGPDLTPPVLTEGTKVPTPSYDNTPNYSFTSTEAGDITVDGACSSTKTDAIAGTNPIEFNYLAPGTYSNCTITVTDDANNVSSPLAVNTFTIQAFVVNPGDTTAPSLDMISPVATPTTDTTPNLTFWSSEAGTITYTGSCASDDVTADSGNNTITLKNLATGTYNNCYLRVTDLSANGNVSAWLAIPSFTITTSSVNPPVTPTDYCAGFSDVSETDSDCDAIEYVKSIGAMTGNPNGTFEPAANLQRDQVAKISLETFDLFSSSKNYCSGNPFPDVTTNEWSYQYICRGVALGMITGYASGADAGYYRPARSVNRVEFLALILRNVDETMPGLNSSSYKDVAAGLWYSGYAKYSYDNSLFTGASLYPDRFVTRREVAKAIFQLHELGKI